jgi:hypothetical protein
MTDDKPTTSDQRTTAGYMEDYEAPSLIDEGSVAELTGSLSCPTTNTGGL